MLEAHIFAKAQVPDLFCGQIMQLSEFLLRQRFQSYT